MKLKPRSKLHILTGLILASGALAFFVLGPHLISAIELWRYGGKPHGFDSVIWKHNQERIRMIDDLMTRYDLQKRSKTEIKSLLGSPDDADYFPEYDFVYRLGPDRGLFHADSEWLCIKFDGQEVKDIQIKTD